MRQNKKYRRLYFAAIFFFAVTLFEGIRIAHAGSPDLTLTTTKNSGTSLQTIPVDVKMDTGGNDVVVVRAVLLYDKNLFTVAYSDVDLTGSVFNTNSCLFPDYFATSTAYRDNAEVGLNYAFNAAARTTLVGKPCQIVTNNTTSGILTLVLVMPSSSAPVNPGIAINTNTPSGLQVATVNFHVKQNKTVANTLNSIHLKFTGVGNYDDSDIIKDTPGLAANNPNAAVDILATINGDSSAPAAPSGLIVN